MTTCRILSRQSTEPRFTRDGGFHEDITFAPDANQVVVYLINALSARDEFGLRWPGARFP